MTTRPPCTVAGCDTTSRHIGLCIKHYQRNRRHGTPTGGQDATYLGPKLPAAPLLAYMETIDTHRPPGASTRDALTNARRRGWVTIYHADRLAIKICGVHPAAIWGEAWWTTGKEDAA